MKRFFKSKIKKIAYQLGYTLAKIPDNTDGRPLPFVKQFQIGPHAFDFWIANERGQFWYDQGEFTDESEAKALMDLIKEGDRILEVGSHHGFYTTLLNHCVGPEGFVLGLEADAQNAQIAQSQVILNHMGSRCSVLHGAGSDRPGTINLSTTDGSNAFVTTGDQPQTMTVQALTGDQLQEKYGPFNVLKIDVEGFETSVLKGCKNILATRPKLALELHLNLIEDYGSNLKEIFDLINVDQYEGCMNTLPDLNTLLPFDPNSLSQKKIYNVYLKPKK